MKFADLLEAGRRLSPEDVRQNLVMLASDPRFAAVAALLEGKHRECARAVAGQGLAGDHGKLAHAAGSLWAFENALGSLKEILEPSVRREPQPPD